MKKISYFFNFIRSYRNILLQVFFFEILYSLRFGELIPLIKTHNNNLRTDTVPCIFFFLHEISKFIKKNKIKSIVDVGSGYVRVVNFLSTLNSSAQNFQHFSNQTLNSIFYRFGAFGVQRFHIF